MKDVKTGGMGTYPMPGKDEAMSKLGESGTTTEPGKSDESDIARSEGLAMGTVSSGQIKATVKTHAPEVTGLTEKSRANQARRENGHADPEGCCD